MTARNRSSFRDSLGSKSPKRPELAVQVLTDAYRNTREAGQFASKEAMASFIQDLTELWLAGELTEDRYRVLLASYACYPLSEAA